MHGAGAIWAANRMVQLSTCLLRHAWRTRLQSAVGVLLRWVSVVEPAWRWGGPRRGDGCSATGLGLPPALVWVSAASLQLALPALRGPGGSAVRRLNKYPVVILFGILWLPFRLLTPMRWQACITGRSKGVGSELEHR
jgi:hypothetical protein